MENYFLKAQKFAKEHIAPFAKEIDEKERYPEESLNEIGKNDFFKLMIPEEMGGLGGNIKDHADVCRAFSIESATVGLCYMMHNVALMCVLTYGSDESKKEVVDSVVNENKFLALAYSELGTGTHFYISDIKTDYSKDRVKFDGLKSMVTSATFASYYLVLAQSEDNSGIDNWVFRKDSGVEFLPSTWHGLGMRGNLSCQMKIDGVELDKKYMLGEPASGQAQVFAVIAPYFVIGLAGVYSGLTEAVLNEAKEHSIDRKYPDGTSLSKFETVQIHLAKIYSMYLSSVSATKEACESALAGDEDALAKILSARIIASESAIESSRLAMRIGGGKAYNREGNLERYLRDAYASQIMAPSVDVLTVWLGKALTGQDLV